MTFSERATLFNDPTFRSKIQQAMVDVAYDVLANPALTGYYDYCRKIVLTPTSKYLIDQWVSAILVVEAFTNTEDDTTLKSMLTTQAALIGNSYNAEQAP